MNFGNNDKSVHMINNNKKVSVFIEIKNKILCSLCFRSKKIFPHEKNKSHKF